MLVVDLKQSDGRYFPAGRTTKNIVGGSSDIQSDLFNMGMVVLDPNGGQVPWHQHSQEEVYIILEGSGEMCIGNEKRILSEGQTVYIPSGKYHQLTNMGDGILKMIYCYAPGGMVSHWQQELAGTLGRAGDKAPPLPENASPQKI